MMLDEEKDLIKKGFIKIPLANIVERRWLAIYSCTKDSLPTVPYMNFRTFIEFHLKHKSKFYILPEFCIKSWIVLLPNDNKPISVYELTKPMWDKFDNKEDILNEFFNINLHKYSYVHLEIKPSFRICNPINPKDQIIP